MADNTNLTQSANRVSFGRGELAKCDLSKTGMIFFATDTQEIIIPTGATEEGVAKYTSFGLSTTDAAKIDASFNNATYSVDTDKAVITFTKNSGKDSVTVEIPLADKSQPGLMTAGQVAMLESAHAGAEFLLGDENTTREITIGEGEEKQTVTLKSVLAAEKSAKDYAKGLVDDLNLDEVSVAGQAIVKISQANGKVAAEAGNISAGYVNVVADHEVTSIPEGGTEEVTNVVNEAISVQEAFNYVNEKIRDLQVVADGVESVVDAAIADLNTTKVGENAFVKVTVTQANGVITDVAVDNIDTASAAALQTLTEAVGTGFGTGEGQQTVAEKIEAVSNAVSTLETGKVADNTAAIAKEIEDREKAISAAVAGLKGTLTADQAATLEGIHARIDDVEEAAGAISYKIKKVTDLNDDKVKEAFRLVDQTGAVADSEVIKIYKDSSMKSITLVDSRPADETKGETEDVPGQYLKYEYYNAEGKTDAVYVDVNLLLAQSEFNNGLQVNDAGEVSVLVDEASEDFLTVSASGVKVSGIQTAINSAVESEEERAKAAEEALDAKIDANAKLSENYKSVSYTEVAEDSDFGECTFIAAAKGDSLEQAIHKVDNNVAVLLGGVLRNELTVSSAITDLDSRLEAIEGEDGSINAALAEANKYTDEKVAALADGAVKANADAIDATNATIGNGFGAGAGQKTVTDKVAELEEKIQANADAMLWWE